MSEFTDFLSKVRRLPAEELVDLGRGALGKVIDGLQKAGHTDQEISAAVMNLTKLFISADQSFNESEYSYWRAVTGVDIEPEELYVLTDGGKNKDFVDSSIEFFKSLDEETRGAAVMFGIAMLACDRNFDVEESELLQRIIVETSNEDK